MVNSSTWGAPFVATTLSTSPVPIPFAIASTILLCEGLGLWSRASK